MPARATASAADCGSPPLDAPLYVNLPLVTFYVTCAFHNRIVFDGWWPHHALLFPIKHAALLQVLGPEHPGLSPQWIASCDMSVSQYSPSSHAHAIASFAVPRTVCIPMQVQPLVNSVAVTSHTSHERSNRACDIIGSLLLQAGLDSLNVAAAGQLFLQHFTLHL